MAAINTPPGPVVYSLIIGDQQMLDYPMDFELRQSWEQHDMWFVRIVVPQNHPNKSNLKPWADGSPVTLTWGRSPTSISVWYGYVNHHEQNSSDDGGTNSYQITYVLIGTSKVLNGHKNRAWVGKTASNIAQAIAYENGWRLVVTRTNWVLPYEVEANESDFQFMIRLANRIGFRFWVSGGTLYFIDPLALLAGSSHYFVPQYTIDQLPYTQDTAKNFRVLQGDNIPGSTQKNRVIYGINNTGGVYRVQADNDAYDFDTVDTNHHATDYQTAKNLANAKKNLTQFWIEATMEVYGYNLLYPGKVIQLGGGAVPKPHQGKWIVTGADHILKPSGNPQPYDDGYVTRITMIRNETSFKPKLGNVQNIVPEFVQCTLSGNTWVAQSRNVVLEGSV